VTGGEDPEPDDQVALRANGTQDSRQETEQDGESGQRSARRPLRWRTCPGQVI
jgi:hypothetical protein